MKTTFAQATAPAAREEAFATTPSTRHASWLTGPAGALVGGAAYALAALLGRLTVLEGQATALVWPAAGVAVVWLLLRGARLVSLDVAVMALATIVVNAMTGAPTALIAVFVVSNVGMAVIQVALLRHFAGHVWGFGGTERPTSLRDLATMVWTTVVATLSSTVVGYVGLLLVLDVPATGWGFALWWGRLLAGAIVVGAPLFLTALALHFGEVRRLVGPVRWEAIGLLAFTVASYVLVFDLLLPLAFVLLAPTVWVAKRLSTVVTTWHTLIGATYAVVATLTGHGPFLLAPGPDVAALMVQVFVTLMALLGLFIAFARDEQAALAQQVAEARKESDRQSVLLRSIVDAMHEGLVVVTGTGEIELRNPATLRLLGIESITHADEVAPSIYLPSGDPIPTERRPSLRALNGEKVHDEDYLMRRVDGSTIRVRVSASYLAPASANDCSRAVMVFHDVSEEVEREESLRAFAGTVAHDLHNPLAAIVGWNAMVVAELDDEPDIATIRRLSDKLGRSAGRLHELIEGLLEHAASRDRTLDLSRVRMGELLGKIVESRGVEDRVRWSSLPAVRADQLLVGQVLDNLVGNALKYVAPGVVPDVQISASTERPGWVTVRITDNGIGIPDGQHEAVFGEFQRAHRDYQGTGLGLSIVQRVVTRHGGTVTALPRADGQGTVFEFTLPAA